jgi:hypothetical protein
MGYLVIAETRLSANGGASSEQISKAHHCLALPKRWTGVTRARRLKPQILQELRIE